MVESIAWANTFPPASFLTDTFTYSVQRFLSSVFTKQKKKKMFFLLSIFVFFSSPNIKHYLNQDAFTKVVK